MTESQPEQDIVAGSRQLSALGRNWSVCCEPNGANIIDHHLLVIALRSLPGLSWLLTCKIPGVTHDYAL